MVFGAVTHYFNYKIYTESVSSLYINKVYMNYIKYITILICLLLLQGVNAQTNFQKSDFAKPSVVTKIKRHANSNSILLLGDVDGNGLLTEKDVDELKTSLITPNYELVNKDAADMNGDGRVSVTDLVILIYQLQNPAIGECNGYEYVDLGLSVKWATCNIGAYAPEDYGYYFTWGGKTENTSYLWYYYEYNTDGCYNSDGCKKYQQKDGQTSGIWYNDNVFVGDNKKVLEPGDDAATVSWGEGWRMPTPEEMNELLTMCTWTWISDSSFKGYKVERFGRYILIPAAGCKYSTATYGKGNYGYYWTNSLLDTYTMYARSLYIHAGGPSLGFDERNYGLTIRPVCP